jgi:hypothetical protein
MQQTDLGTQLACTNLQCRMLQQVSEYPAVYVNSNSRYDIPGR